MDRKYGNTSFRCSRVVTRTYSTSFSLGVMMLHPSLRDAIYSIYGFVRLADEIVDTFHEFNKAELLQRFEEDFYRAMDEGISLNPILNAFQQTVKKYSIDNQLIQAFLSSMKSDLTKKEFNNEEIKKYIFGSADVVGLMCLKVFTGGNNERYEELKPFAMKLGSAFQKVNFLRDLNQDKNFLQRVYFPELNHHSLDTETKKIIIDDIESDFAEALKGIKKLPNTSKASVYTAFLYYRALLRKIKKTPPTEMVSARIRISNARKTGLLLVAWICVKLNVL